MDPYLEARWSDVHVSLIACVREALQPLLPGDLRARAEERVLLETIGGTPLATYRGDVAVVRSGHAERHGTAPGTATVEPVLVEVHPVPEVDRFVQIVDIRSGNRVVTVIEVLSPGNKGPGQLNEAYRRKLQDYALGEVNVVEIDLLRSPRGRLEVGQQDLPENRRAPYLTCVRRAARPGCWEVYPMPLQAPLPGVPIPLRKGEADVVLDLQPLIARVYAGGGHDDIDYRGPPDPPLDGEDAAWADSLLRSCRRR
jgi:hypothetical protein